MDADLFITIALCGVALLGVLALTLTLYFVGGPSADVDGDTAR